MTISSYYDKKPQTDLFKASILFPVGSFCDYDLILVGLFDLPVDFHRLPAAYRPLFRPLLLTYISIQIKAKFQIEPMYGSKTCKYFNSNKTIRTSFAGFAIQIIAFSTYFLYGPFFDFG